MNKKKLSVNCGEFFYHSSIAKKGTSISCGDKPPCLPRSIFSLLTHHQYALFSGMTTQFPMRSAVPLYASPNPSNPELRNSAEGTIPNCPCQCVERYRTTISSWPSLINKKGRRLSPVGFMIRWLVKPVCFFKSYSGRISVEICP